MRSVHVQCGREDEDEFQEVWPLGAIFGDWIPQLLFSQERRIAELSSPGGAALTISPVPQAPLYLPCCPEPRRPSQDMAASPLLRAGRSKALRRGDSTSIGKPELSLKLLADLYLCLC